jgi:hypothetical protein
MKRTAAGPPAARARRSQIAAPIKAGGPIVTRTALKHNACSAPRDFFPTRTSGKVTTSRKLFALTIEHKYTHRADVRQTANTGKKMKI